MTFVSYVIVFFLLPSFDLDFLTQTNLLANFCLGLLNLLVYNAKRAHQWVISPEITLNLFFQGGESLPVVVDIDASEPGYYGVKQKDLPRGD